MIVKSRYFELKEKKVMQDGHFIPAYQKLLYICTDENLMQFETCDSSDIKRIFWTTEEEVSFIEEIEEEWASERIQQQQKEIHGDWLTK